jgi:hypothetical protein
MEEMPPNSPDFQKKKSKSPDFNDEFTPESYPDEKN